METAEHDNGAEHEQGGADRLGDAAALEPAHRRAEQEREQHGHDDREHECAPDLECRNCCEKKDADERPGHELTGLCSSASRRSNAVT